MLNKTVQLASREKKTNQNSKINNLMFTWNLCIERLIRKKNAEHFFLYNSEL